MKQKLFTAMAAALFVTAAMMQSANADHLANPNLFSDPGFEDTLAGDGSTPWVSFNSVDGSSVFGLNPRNGAQSLELGTTADNNFSGAFQDVRFLSSLDGTRAWFSGFHTLAAGDAGGTEIRIEWRDSVNNVEISRTANLAPTLVLGAAYEEFILTDLIPAGADTARVVYAAQSFGGTTTNQTINIDDANFNIAGVPEPTTGCLAMVGLTLFGLRRRRG